MLGVFCLESAQTLQFAGLLMYPIDHKFSHSNYHSEGT